MNKCFFVAAELFTRIIPDATSTAIDIAEGSHTQPGISYTLMLWLKPESTL